MHQRARRDGVSLVLIEGPIRRTYRPLSAQIAARRMWCNAGNCGNAAVPGTSNHGLGTTVDLMSMTQRRWIDRHGATFGWAKKWSDASWEWWHLRYHYGVIARSALKSGPRVIRKGSRPGEDIQALQVLLRRAGYIPAKRHVGKKYGAYTIRRVKKFQRDHHLKADGVVGPKTLKAIKKAARRR
jgi:Putative peptidoglycan binding domain